MDLNMSVMSGFDATIEIINLSKQGVFHRPTIIACTAFVDSATKEQWY
jgi:CheY-like chemotaxis protein